MNKRRAKAVLKDIEKHWKNYDQNVYHDKNSEVGACLSIHCVAGFCQLRAKKIRKRDGISPRQVRSDPFYVGKKYLEVTTKEASHLFSSTRSWEEVKEILETGKFPEWVYDPY